MNVHPTEMRVARTYLSPDDIALLKVTVLPQGTSVFPKVGGAVLTNKKRLIVTPGAVDLNTMGVIPGPRLDARFLRAWLQALDLRTLVDGSVLPQISQNRVRDLEIPVPVLGEQRRLVDILEDHLSRLDAGESGVERAALQLNALEVSFLDRLHAGLIDRGVRDSTLDGLAELTLGKMLDAKRAQGAPTRYLRNINVRWRHFDLSDLRTVPLSEAEIARFDVRDGDVFVCEGGEPGRCAVWELGASGLSFQKALHRVRIKDASVASPRYIAMMIEYLVRSGRAEGLLTGTTIKHLPREKLKLLSIPTPPMSDQTTAVEEFESLVSEVKRLQRSAVAARQRSAALRRALLQAAFSGRLTGRASDVDRAEELVETGAAS